MTTPTQEAHDPVCHMDIDMARAAGRSDYEEHSYYFCSMGCKREFDGDPEGVLKREGEYDHNQPVAMMMEEHPKITTPPVAAKPWWRIW